MYMYVYVCICIYFRTFCRRIKNSLEEIPKLCSNILNENLLKISRNQCSTNYSSSL